MSGNQAFYLLKFRLLPDFAIMYSMNLIEIVDLVNLLVRISDSEHDYIGFFPFIQ